MPNSSWKLVLVCASPYSTVVSRPSELFWLLDQLPSRLQLPIFSVKISSLGLIATCTDLLVWLARHLADVNYLSYVVKEESSYPLEELKVTQLHFFHQDLVSGANPTAVTVARPNGTASPLLFGTVAVFDNRLTEGVDPASPMVGNAQGIYAFTGRDNFSMFVTADFGFTTGKYNGSSISITTRNTFLETEREQAVVGGRGQFRLARGFARLTTRLRSGPDAIVEYNVTVLHY